MTNAAPALETALVFSVAQIIEGEATCAYCERGAVLTIATGADPDAEPVCFDHWKPMHELTWVTLGRLYGPNG